MSNHWNNLFVGTIKRELLFFFNKLEGKPGTTRLNREIKYRSTCINHLPSEPLYRMNAAKHSTDHLWLMIKKEWNANQSIDFIPTLYISSSKNYTQSCTQWPSGFSSFSYLQFGESKPAKQVNETDLQAAMADMRTRSYHGFVILLQFVHISSIPELLRNTDITFFMPNDQELSGAAVTPHHLQEFILSHDRTRFRAFAAFSKWIFGSIKHPQQDHQRHPFQKIRLVLKQCQNCHSKCL